VVGDGQLATEQSYREPRGLNEPRQSNVGLIAVAAGILECTQCWPDNSHKYPLPPWLSPTASTHTPQPFGGNMQEAQWSSHYNSKYPPGGSSLNTTLAVGKGWGQVAALQPAASEPRFGGATVHI
jgi:hypothetical protein